jgi:hypothetical protein
MGYLFFQIWLWVIASFFLGWFSHWFLSRLEKDQDQLDEESNSKKNIPNDEQEG